jgi:hypothetical protein
MATQPQVTTGGPRQLVLVAALAGVLLLAVGLLVVRPLVGGSDQGQAPPAVTSAGAAPATTTPQLIPPSTSVAPDDGAAATGKDPFKPLVTAGAAAAATGSGATATTVGSATATSSATGSTVAGAAAGTATTPGGGTGTERQVALVSITGGTAKVTVDGTPYSVTEGETFAGSYRAVDINSECASFESATTSFTLCEGEAVLK